MRLREAHQVLVQETQARMSVQTVGEDEDGAKGF